MGAESVGRMAHAADRRWRVPDVDAVSLEAADDAQREGVSDMEDCQKRESSKSSAATEDAAGGVASPIGAIRLNPVERANPAFQNDPAFGRTASGAYGGRGPRVEGAGDAGEQAQGLETGRWVRTGGCGFRWVKASVEDASESYSLRWRCIAVADEGCGGEGADASGPTPVVYGDFSYLDNGDGTVALVAYEGDGATSIDIPGVVDGKEVSVLGAALFSNHLEIERVSVPDSVRIIDEHAFDGCSSLAEVELSSALEHIGMFAFAKAGLVSICLPASLKTISAKAFFHCKRLASIALPASLVEIGESAFAYSGIERVVVPASVEKLGFNAFDLTPAQKNVASGMIRVEAGNARYRLDGAGLYCGDELIELIGYVREYEVVSSTKRIGEGACKRHPTIAHVILPEGLTEIGDDAFRSNRNLRYVDLPESLERIGSRAFVDTSLATLRISRNVTHIGNDALLVQGEAQMSSKKPLSSIDLDPANPVFYLQNGLLCERDTSPGGGDTCLLYLGPDAVVHIPDQVTNIAVMAFGGAVGVDELYVHDHMHSFCYGWLSMKEAIRIVHVQFGEEVDGYLGGDFPLPNLSTRFRYMTDLFTSSNGKTVFDFDYYDAWVTCSSSINELAPAAYERMRHPMGMSEHSRSVYEGIFERKGARICRYFAEHSNMEALEMLADGGWIDLSDIESELEIAMRDGRPQATACLLEMKHRMEPDATEGGLDFSL